MFSFSDGAARGVTHDGLPTTFPAGAVIDVYTTPRPANANAAATGTKIGTGVLPATPWAAASGRGTPKNGTWQITGITAAGAGTDMVWGRMRAAADPGGADANQIRADFDIVEPPATGDAIADNTNIADTQVVNINTFAIAVP